MYFSLDTCGGTGSIAFGRWKYADGRGDDELCVFAETAIAGKAYAALLIPALQSLLDEQSRTMEDISGIVVVNGPGSFTGVRIGVSSAKALAEVLEVPIVAVSRLALLMAKTGCPAAATDAGRGEFYFRIGEDESLLTPAAIRERIRDLGPTSLAICEENAAKAFPEATLIEPPHAADALLLAAERLMNGKYDNVATLDSNYVRRTDAELFAKPSEQPATEGVGV